MKGNRRQFFVGASASIGIAAIQPRDASADDRVKPIGFDGFQDVELAIATICTDGFGNRHHDPAFQVIPSLGFQNVEFNLWHTDMLTPSYMRNLAERCQASGLKPVSLQGTSFGSSSSSGLMKDIAHKMLFLQYCKMLNCHIAKFTGSRRGTNGGLQAIIDACKELAPAAEELGVVVALENHTGNNLETLEDYDRILEAIDSPNIGLCLDTGHFEGSGIKLSDVLDRFGNRTIHVDLKDCKAFGQGHNTVPFGQGVTDFDSFLSELMAQQYAGYLVIEQAWPEPKGNWKEDLKSSRKRFAKWENTSDN